MRSLLVSVVLALAVLAAGCGGARHDTTEKYYLVAANVKLAYWQSAQAGLAKAARELGVQAETVGPDGLDANAELEAFNKALAKKPAGILVSASNPDILKPAIDSAIAQGIPVIAMDADAPASKRLAFIGTNNYQAGLMGGKLLAKELKGKGNVVVFTYPNQLNLEERLHGYRDAIGDGGIKITEVVDTKADPRAAFDLAEQMVKNAPKIDAFVCLASALCPEVAEVLTRHKISKVIVAMDTNKETLEWIQKGVIVATIGQKPYTMAFYGLKMLDDVHHYPLSPLDKNWGQDAFAPLPSFVDTGATLIDKSNVDEFLRARDASGR